MNLIKKTVILTDADAEGYVSVIRVGNDVGAKIVGSNFRSGMRAGIRVGNGNPVFAVLTGEKTEIPLLNVTFQQNDSIGCVVADGEKLVARGGSGLRLKDLVAHFEVKEETLVTEPLFAPDAEKDGVEATERDEKPDAPKRDDAVSEEETKNASADLDDEKKSFLERLSASHDDFYGGIREKLDELFVIHPAESYLNALIPNSSWIKIYYDGDEYYVVGKLNENNRTVLIGYGVPGAKTSTPPKIADEIASYLAVEGIKPYDGYWLIFQDANTGKIVPVT